MGRADPDLGHAAAGLVFTLCEGMPAVTRSVSPVLGNDVITVASVPANHVYVRHLSAPTVRTGCGGWSIRDRVAHRVISRCGGRR